jgi:hypothetical protein
VDLPPSSSEEALETLRDALRSLDRAGKEFLSSRGIRTLRRRGKGKRQRKRLQRALAAHAAPSERGDLAEAVTEAPISRWGRFVGKVRAFWSKLTGG